MKRAEISDLRPNWGTSPPTNTMLAKLYENKWPDWILPERARGDNAAMPVDTECAIAVAEQVID